VFGVWWEKYERAHLQVTAATKEGVVLATDAERRIADGLPDTDICYGASFALQQKTVRRKTMVEAHGAAEPGLELARPIWTLPPSGGREVVKA